MTKNGADRASACQHRLYQNRRHRKAEGSRSELVGLILLGAWDTHERSLLCVPTCEQERSWNTQQYR